MHLKTLLIIAFRQFKSFCSKSEFIFWILPKNPFETFHSLNLQQWNSGSAKLVFIKTRSDPKTNQHWQRSAEIWSQECRTKMGSSYCPISSAFSVKPIKVWLTLFLHEADVINHQWSCWCWPCEVRRRVCPTLSEDVILTTECWNIGLFFFNITVISNNFFPPEVSWSSFSRTFSDIKVP